MTWPGHFLIPLLRSVLIWMACNFDSSLKGSSLHCLVSICWWRSDITIMESTVSCPHGNAYWKEMRAFLTQWPRSMMIMMTIDDDDDDKSWYTESSWTSSSSVSLVTRFKTKKIWKQRNNNYWYNETLVSGKSPSSEWPQDHQLYDKSLRESVTTKCVTPHGKNKQNNNNN